MRGADVTKDGLFVTRKTVDSVPEGHPRGMVSLRFRNPASS